TTPTTLWWAFHERCYYETTLNCEPYTRPGIPVREVDFGWRSWTILIRARLTPIGWSPWSTKTCAVSRPDTCATNGVITRCNRPRLSMRRIYSSPRRNAWSGKTVPTSSALQRVSCGGSCGSTHGGAPRSNGARGWALSFSTILWDSPAGYPLTCSISNE